MFVGRYGKRDALVKLGNKGREICLLNCGNQVELAY